MYFPRTFDAVEVESQEQGKADRPEGNETILLVEDEADVRCLVCEVLQQHGYTVLTSAQPQDALEICETHAGLIDLLLTDVVLPQMSGRDLAERIGLARPHIRVLFMSGYTENAMLGAGIPGSEEAFLKKPFTPAMLTQKIREVLDVQEKGLGAAAD
jgi:CheY-like chemotaxis protein